MKLTRYLTLFLAVLIVRSLTDRAAADTFGSGANTFNIEFVHIGNPGNVADTTGAPNPAGSVPYTYRMGKYEISEQMIDKANALGLLGITKDTRSADKPATSLTWFEAAKFVNWLNTSNGSNPAYKFDDGGNFKLWMAGDEGFNPNNLYRNKLAKYFLPSAHEWYKAAFYDPSSGVYYDYPTGSNTAPTAVASGTSAGTAVYFRSGPADITLAGGLSPYGTMAQGGNVVEWEETNVFLADDPNPPPELGLSARGVRGGDWANSSQGLSASSRIGVDPTLGVLRDLGFRVASIPEPSSVLLAALANVGMLLRRRR